MRSRVPCESMLRSRELACSKSGMDVNSFIPLDTLVNVAERMASDGKLHTNIPSPNWGNDLTASIFTPHR